MLDLGNSSVPVPGIHSPQNTAFSVLRATGRGGGWSEECGGLATAVLVHAEQSTSSEFGDDT